MKTAKEKCNSNIEFGDDFGDNSTTFHCQLEKGHQGKHKEQGNLYDQQEYVLEWEDKVKQKGVRNSSHA